MTMVNPLRDNLDTFTICGVPSPGKCIVDAGSVGAKWDEQAGPGTAGSTLTFAGPILGELKIDLQMWTDIHFVLWDAFKTFLVSPPIIGLVVKPVALEIHHPLVDETGKNQWVFVSREALKPIGEKGLWGTQLLFREYKKPKPILGNANANGTIDAVKPAAGSTPNADLDAAKKNFEASKQDALDASDE